MAGIVIITFNLAINLAVDIVKKDHPEAKLLEATASTADGEYITNPDHVNVLRVLFRIPGGHIEIRSKPGTITTFEKPVVYKTAWLGDVVIPWPVNLTLEEAYKYAVEAEHKHAFNAVTLRHPLYPGVKDPYYIFQIHGGKHIFVNVKSHKVSLHE